MDALQEAWRADLELAFPGWGTPAWTDGWRARTAPVAIGQKVSGAVIAVAEHGVWLDVGLGTPGLLLVTNMVGPAPIVRESYPPKGAQLTLWVYRVGPAGEVSLSQHSPPG
jgi:hypothetical protein